MSSRFSAARQPERQFPTAYLPKRHRNGMASHEETLRRRDAEQGSKKLAAAIDNYTLTKLAQMRAEELNLADKIEAELTGSMLKEGE